MKVQDKQNGPSKSFRAYQKKLASYAPASPSDISASQPARLQMIYTCTQFLGCIDFNLHIRYFSLHACLSTFCLQKLFVCLFTSRLCIILSIHPYQFNRNACWQLQLQINGRFPFSLCISNMEVPMHLTVICIQFNT